jgi:hypothetical protein
MQVPKKSRQRPYLVADDACMDVLVDCAGLFDPRSEPLALDAEIYQRGDEVSLVELNRAEVLDMLQRVGAPEPWHNAEACAAIRVAKLPTVVARPRLEGEVQDLVAKLRSRLAQLICERLSDLEWADDVGQLSNEIKIWRRLLKAAQLAQECKWGIRDEPEPEKCSWHFLALELLKFYRVVVNPSCGVSADGPAVRFIEAALKRFEIQGTRTRHAIAKALQRIS